jgi:hypothetical protein
VQQHLAQRVPEHVVLRIALHCASNQRQAFLGITGLGAQDAEQMQYLRIVRVSRKQFAITGFGFAQATGAVQFDDVVEHQLKTSSENGVGKTGPRRESR